MLTIRLTRIGKKNQPSFRVVVVDKRRSASAGKSLEILGTKNPHTKKVTLDKERINYWISKGAQPSPSVFNLLVSEKVIEGKKIAKHKVKPVIVTPVASAPVTPTPAPEAPKTPEAPVAPETIETPKEPEAPATPA